MPQPTAYTPDYSFTDHSTNFPTTPQPGDKLDGEFNAIADTLSETRTNLALIQRDDGAIANDSVGRDALKAEVVSGINTPVPWVTATTYTVRDSVVTNSKWYWCTVAHTSATFATELAAGKWELIFDFTDLAVVIAGAIPSSYLDLDDTMAANSDVKIPSQNAIRAYIATALAAYLSTASAAATYLTAAAAAAGYQPLDAQLTAFAGLSPAADQFPYFTATNTMALLTVTSAMRAVLDDTTMKAARTTLGVNNIFTSTVIANPADGDYTLHDYFPYACKIVNVTTVCTAGTVTATSKINTTALGGTANSVSTSAQTQAHSTNNTVAAGDNLVVTLSANASSANVTITYELELQ